eukprot:GDKK01070860.1.p1 GENE.GDKK01070860.1~~GDKK01070860.1.p1  ORF type:complete len:444 (+),score=119.66 GDKK01070860.1:329-1660(+)
MDAAFSFLVPHQHLYLRGQPLLFSVCSAMVVCDETLSAAIAKRKATMLCESLSNGYKASCGPIGHLQVAKIYEDAIKQIDMDEKSNNYNYNMKNKKSTKAVRSNGSLSISNNHDENFVQQQPSSHFYFTQQLQQQQQLHQVFHQQQYSTLNTAASAFGYYNSNSLVSQYPQTMPYMNNNHSNNHSMHLGSSNVPTMHNQQFPLQHSSFNQQPMLYHNNTAQNFAPYGATGTENLAAMNNFTPRSSFFATPEDENLSMACDTPRASRQVRISAPPNDEAVIASFNNTSHSDVNPQNTQDDDNEDDHNMNKNARENLNVADVANENSKFSLEIPINNKHSNDDCSSSAMRDVLPVHQGRVSVPSSSPLFVFEDGGEENVGVLNGNCDLKSRGLKIENIKNEEENAEENDVLEMSIADLTNGVTFPTRFSKRISGQRVSFSTKQND